MHPAFSVILFTTLSGTGLGLWGWLALRIALGDSAQWFDGLGWAWGLIAGAVLVSAGLLASFWHLGKPLRAWRAFSQWRTSWLSREGVLAVACYVPAAALLLILSVWVELPDETLALRIVAALLVPLCVATVYCTAMIYASLPPIPAWRHPLVVPVYLLFAALGGGIGFALCAGTTVDAPNMIGLWLAFGALALWRVKRRYWRDLDAAALAQTTGDAVGLPGRTLRSFERPHTEANYLTREMGFVVARKHARKLRAIATVLFSFIPALCALPLWLLPHADAAPLLWTAAIAFQLGAAVERWLFFAEAKHVVTLYYQT